MTNPKSSSGIFGTPPWRDDDRKRKGYRGKPPWSFAHGFWNASTARLRAWTDACSWNGTAAALRASLPTNWATGAYRWNALPALTGAFCLKSALGVTVALYILNQNHLLPRPLSAVVSKALFWPTMPITVGRRIGVWTTVIDDTVVMGGAPFGFARLPEKLYEDYGVGRKSIVIVYATPSRLLTFCTVPFNVIPGPRCYKPL
jgi:hypothetical protein